jgi:hypothetical protein
MLLWSDRPEPTRRVFSDASGGEWKPTGEDIVCAGCGRGESSGWQRVSNAERVCRCKRCVSVTYTDWEG